MKRLGLALVVLLVLGAGSTALAFSPKLEVDENMWIQLGFLLQLQYETVEDIAGTNNDEWSNDFFTRRARILALGSVHEKVKFFFDTDVPNAGKKGSNNDLIWNDGLIDCQVMPEFNLSMGRILPPFSLETQASATTLLGIDYNLNSIKLPTPNDRSFWRDDGLEARGMLVNKLIDYRFGVFRGARDDVLNPDQDLRYSGMVMFNFFDSQPGWFYNMNSLGSLKMLSIGAGFDLIQNSGSGVDDGEAWSIFGLFDHPLGGGIVTAAAAWYDWEGPSYGGFEGETASVQIGYLCPGQVGGGRFQPVVRWQRQDPDGGQSLNTVNLGLNYYLKGHHINFKVDYAIDDRRNADADGDKVDAFRFQTQLYY